jgi:hypothetical protein
MMVGKIWIRVLGHVKSLKALVKTADSIVAPVIACPSNARFL